MSVIKENCMVFFSWFEILNDLGKTTWRWQSSEGTKAAWFMYCMARKKMRSCAC